MNNIIKFYFLLIKLLIQLISNTILTVEKQSSQKKKVHRYSGLAIAFKIISSVNASNETKDIPSNKGSTEIEMPECLISSENNAQNIKKNIKD